VNGGNTTEQNTNGKDDGSNCSLLTAHCSLREREREREKKREMGHAMANDVSEKMSERAGARCEDSYAPSIHGQIQAANSRPMVLTTVAAEPINEEAEQ